MTAGETLARRINQTAVRRAVLCAVLLFDLFIAWTVFYSPIDDWRWSIDEIGLRWWLEGIYNNRYAGNFFAVLLTRSAAVKTLVMGGCMFALPLLMAVLAARGKRERIFPLAIACGAGLLMMPSVMWRETYYWVSGFGNFVVPTVLFLVWLLILRRVADVRDHLRGWSALLLPMSLVLGLFIENLTLLFFGASLILAGYAVRDKALRLPFWACLAGSGLAVFVMFFNGVYLDLAESGAAIDGYRQLSISLEGGLGAAAGQLLEQYVCQLLPRAFTLGIHMGLPMAVITALGFWHSRLRPLCVLGVVPLLHCAVVISLQVIDKPWACAGSAVSWALPLAALLAQREERERKRRRVLLYLAAPLSLLPLAATTSLVIRHHFFPMVMVILVAADEAEPLLARRWGVAVPALLLAGLMLSWGVPCAHVAGCTQLRESLIQEPAEWAGQEQLILPTDRYQYTIWAGRNAYDPDLANCFREINGLSRDTTLVFLPPGTYETWPNISPEQWGRRVEFGPSYEPLRLIP